MTIKQQLYQACQISLQSKLKTIQLRLKDIDDAMANETKSSVGDKYETGRAMLHLEKEKMMQQLATLNQDSKILQSIDPKQTFDTAQLGALVSTKSAQYFIALGLGKVKLGPDTIFVISPHSPIGKLLLQKKTGDIVSFRNKSMLINAID